MAHPRNPKQVLLVPHSARPWAQDASQRDGKGCVLGLSGNRPEPVGTEIGCSISLQSSMLAPPWRIPFALAYNVRDDWYTGRTSGDALVRDA